MPELPKLTQMSPKMNSQDLQEAGLGGYPSDMTFDVVANYNWAISGLKNKARAEVPYIELVEFQQNASALVQSVNYWFQQAKETKEAIKERSFKFKNPYAGLYSAQATGITYRFPYYSEYHHNITNNWGENKGPLGELVDAAVVPVAKVLFPTGGIETAKAWEGTTAASYDIVFQLLNTVDCANDIQRNKELIDVLIRANLKYQLNTVAALPPVFYDVTIPGIRWAPVAVISNLAVTHKGQMNTLTFGGIPSIIPDAYEVRLQITELINESRNLFEFAMTGKKPVVGVITPPLTLEENQKNLKQNEGQSPGSMNPGGPDPTETPTNQAIKTDAEVAQAGSYNVSLPTGAFGKGR